MEASSQEFIFASRCNEPLVFVPEVRANVHQPCHGHAIICMYACMYRRVPRACSQGVFRPTRWTVNHSLFRKDRTGHKV